MLNVGDSVEATVLGVDLERRRISLTLDASKQGEGVPDVRDYAPPSKSQARGRQGPSRPSRRPEKSMGSFGALLQESMNKQR